MTIIDLSYFKKVVSEHEAGYDLIVHVIQKYKHESDFRHSNQLLLWDSITGEHYWLNDWYEGEEYFGIESYERVENISW